jgi:hypothetical protein
MKSFIKYSLAASLVAGAIADSHQHLHQHAKKNAGSRVEKRKADPVTEYVVGPTETVYELGGKVIDAAKAKEGLEDGDFIVIGETTPTFTPPPPPPKPTPSTSAEPDMGAKFIESKEETSEAPTSTPEPKPEPEPTTSSEAPPPPPKPSSKPSNDLSGGSGLDAKFPSGKVSCDEFPSKYGAIALDWLDLGGWSSLQFVPEYTYAAKFISKIRTGISGESCAPGGMCSYACPPGYQKTQWPKAQGETRQSIGGLYCNNEGFLELTRPEFETLCEKGEGGVTIKNDLDEEVCTCRTDYPGDESMVIPMVAKPGSTVEVCNPHQDKYYQWDGMSTSAQMYINKKGYGLKDACVWNSAKDPSGAGNWSPTILGVGKAGDGNTYISIFRNLPSSHAELDFNIEITGDVNSKCAFINGKFTGGSDGCTTAMKDGGSVTVRYF